MVFTPKDWRDYPDLSTPINAASMEDLETRLAAYADSAGSLYRVEILPYGHVNASQGSYAFSTDSGGRYYNTNVQNDYLEYIVGLGAGTWACTIISQGGADRAILTATIDGTSVGTADFYTATQTDGVRQTITGINVPTSGSHLFRLTAATKNASSSGYYIVLVGISLARTA